MQKTVEFTGKKVQDAVSEGLKTLGITLDDAEIKILAQGGLFKKAKVAITYDDGLTEEQAKAQEAQKAAQAQTAPVAPREERPRTERPREERPRREKPVHKDSLVPPEGEPHWGSAPVKREPSTASHFGEHAAPKPAQKKEPTEPRQKQENKQRETHHEHREPRPSVQPTEEQMTLAKTFLTELLGHMGIEGTIEVTADEGMRINVNTEDARVIGHRGEVLDAMQQLVSTQINTTHGNFVHITVDGLGYRDRRKESLEGLARRMADKAVRTHRKVSLDVMNSADRRVIHAALGEREDVFTRSEGHEPTRRVVIIPKRNNNRGFSKHEYVAKISEPVNPTAEESAPAPAPSPEEETAE